MFILTISRSSFYRYNEKNEPKEVKFIDFQSARISSLVTDILTFCFTSMSSMFRREYISELLEVTWNPTSMYIDEYRIRLGRVLAYGFPLTEFGGFHGPSSANSKLFHGSEFQLVKDRGNNKNSSSIV